MPSFPVAARVCQGAEELSGGDLRSTPKIREKRQRALHWLELEALYQGTSRVQALTSLTAFCRPPQGGALFPC